MKDTVRNIFFANSGHCFVFSYGRGIYLILYVCSRDLCKFPFWCLWPAQISLKELFHLMMHTQCLWILPKFFVKWKFLWISMKNEIKCDPVVMNPTWIPYYIFVCWYDLFIVCHDIKLNSKVWFLYHFSTNNVFEIHMIQNFHCFL